MNTTAGRKTIGFDRKIRLDWLDATAEWAAQGLSLPEIRSRLEKLLEGQVAGSGNRSARDKTMTVLLHVWVDVPEAIVPLRDDGLALLRKRSGRDRLPLHWGMSVTTYPFFRDVVATTGRLLSLQGKAALSQIARRTAESWGERSTVARATRRVVRSLVDWRVLMETQERGIFSAAPRIEVTNKDGIGPWLVEASISNCDRRAGPLRSLLTSSAYFPFDLCLSHRELANSPRLEIHRQGLDEEVVTLKQAR